MMLYTRKQMERELDRRMHEEYMRMSRDREFEDLCKRVFALEERVRTLEYKVAPEGVLTNTEARA